MDRVSIRTDKVLSKIALGFMAPGLVGFELFPRVSVDEASGKIIQFDKSAFQLINTRRAPGERKIKQEAILTTSCSYGRGLSGGPATI